MAQTRWSGSSSFSSLEIIPNATIATQSTAAFADETKMLIHFCGERLRRKPNAASTICNDRLTRTSTRSSQKFNNALTISIYLTIL
ncbi:calcium-activated chloride channel regulator 1 precursor [Corchorus capsularis]|uniref:Calcium-activated chloride channel regulator 1 n=1 Tax=Corchorus capsularis TaxID=210143 RepID=A0A1R3IYT6_COCAP|nr:calcium-activated chloride channel regulator 1 precursor [Corchorus capsularis]